MHVIPRCLFSFKVILRRRGLVEREE